MPAQPGECGRGCLDFGSNCWLVFVFPSHSFPSSRSLDLVSLLHTGAQPPPQIHLLLCSALSPISTSSPLFFFFAFPAHLNFVTMFSRGTLPAFVLSLALAALADPVPSTPNPGAVYNEGSNCDIGWTPDSTGQWKTMNIQLMTGDNFQMVPLTSPSYCIYFQVISI